MRKIHKIVTISVGKKEGPAILSKSDYTAKMGSLIEEETAVGKNI